MANSWQFMAGFSISIKNRGPSTRGAGALCIIGILGRLCLWQFVMCSWISHCSLCVCKGGLGSAATRTGTGCAQVHVPKPALSGKLESNQQAKSSQRFTPQMTRNKSKNRTAATVPGAPAVLQCFAFCVFAARNHRPGRFQGFSRPPLHTVHVHVIWAVLE